MNHCLKNRRDSLMNIRFVDSHCHLDMVNVFDPQGITWVRDMVCLPISWSFSGEITAADDLKTYFRKQQDVISQLNHNGLRCYYLSGIHPRDIPVDLGAEMVRELLTPNLDDPLCLGIGETGLETGSEQEKEILAAQLDMAGEVAGRGKIFGIHTPRQDKARITGELLEMLRDYPAYRENIVVDHCTEETIASVLQMGLWAGITMNPEKIRTDNLVRIIQAHKKDMGRIMLNTDSSTSFYRDLSILSREETIEERDRTALLRDNALRFYHLE